MHTGLSLFSARHIPAGFARGARALSPGVILAAAGTIAQLLMHPRRAGTLAGGGSESLPSGASLREVSPNNSVAVSPYSLLVLSFLASLVRISRDPGVAVTAGFLGLGTEWIALIVPLTAAGAVVGSIFMPAFWYRILGLRSERNTFIGAMVLMYASVVIPWDISSALWIPLVREFNVPIWLPELIKTGVITAYCSIAGSEIPAKESYPGTE